MFFGAIIVGNPIGKRHKKKIVVSGSVTNQSGQPISNASIFLDEQNSNRITDQDGQSSIRIRGTSSVNASNEPLIISITHC
jgi:hypothetical protein